MIGGTRELESIECQVYLQPKLGHQWTKSDLFVTREGVIEATQLNVCEEMLHKELTLSHTADSFRVQIYVFKENISAYKIYPGRFLYC
jgi:hypothetical protein